MRMLYFFKGSFFLVSALFIFSCVHRQPLKNEVVEGTYYATFTDKLFTHSNDSTTKKQTYIGVIDIHNEYILYFLEPVIVNKIGKPIISQSLCILTYSKGKIYKSKDAYFAKMNFTDQLKSASEIYPIDSVLTINYINENLVANGVEYSRCEWQDIFQ